MSVTLMNNALFCAKQESLMAQTSSPSFSVQSKKEIRCLSAFEVPKATYEVFHWMFTRAPFIVEKICAQMSSEKLDILGFGIVEVDWHLGGDLKTIKCLLGCKQGVNSLLSCSFCTHGFKKPMKGQNATTGGLRTAQSIIPQPKAQDATNGKEVEREWDTSLLSYPMLDE